VDRRRDEGQVQGHLSSIAHGIGRSLRQSVPPDEQLVRHATVLTCAALVVTLLLTISFWLPQREYPLVPIGGVELGPITSRLLIGLLLLSLTVIIFVPFPQPILLAPAGAVLVLIAADQSRFQPYIYMFLLAMLLLALARARAREDPVLDGLRLLCAGAYFWSGVQKMNPLFGERVVPNFFGPFLNRLPLGDVAMGRFLDGIAFSVPLIEAAIGLLLILNVRRWIPIMLAAGMLALVLASLGPWAMNWNIVVWAWNLWLFAMTVWLFSKPVPAARLFSLRLNIEHAAKAAIIILIWIAPAAGLLGFWDAYPSFKLYSGNTVEAQVVIHPADRGKLPPRFLELANGDRIPVARLTYAFHNVAPYPEERVFVAVWRGWCTRYGLSHSRLRLTWPSGPLRPRDRGFEAGCEFGGVSQ
jgi:hypothetical protein